MSENFDRKKIEDAIRQYDNDINKINEDLAQELNDIKVDTPSEKISVGDASKVEIPDVSTNNSSSSGYNPDFKNNVSSGNSGNSPTRDSGVSRNSAPSTNNNVGGESPRSSGLDKKEQAPDIGKDYGSSSNSNGQQPGGLKSNNEGGEIENFPERENPVDSSLPNQNPNQDGKTTDDKLKKDGLTDEEGKDEQGRKKGDESPKSGEENKVNPEATDSSKKVEDTSKSDNTGNGYGSLDKKKQNDRSTNDGTDLARRNLEHNNRVQQGKEAEGSAQKKAVDSTPKTSQNTGNPFANLNIGQRLQNGLRNMFGSKGGTSTTSRGIKPGQKVSGLFGGSLKSKLMLFLKTHPTLILIIAVVVIILLIILYFAAEEYNPKKNGGTHCTYKLNGVTSTGTVELSNLKVNILNCDATESNYTVLETVDFEKYILGVLKAEMDYSAPDEALKAQIIAIRNFTLTRNSQMCPSDKDNCFYGYNVNTEVIQMRACVNDQVYCDYTRDCYRQERSGLPALVTPEENSGPLWKAAADEASANRIKELSKQVIGEYLVGENGDVLSLGYTSTETNKFIELAEAGKTYKEILLEVYSSKNPAGFNSAVCTSYGNIDYGDYVLSSDGHTVLNQRLDTFLQSKGTSLEEFNALIASNVENAGFGTRAGVVTAAVTLIAELGNNYNVKVPYYLSGGHYDGVVSEALGYWGDTCPNYYGYGNVYNVCGLDCSGFVPWAIKTGGYNVGVRLAGDFQYISGAKKVTLSASQPVLQPGDILESSGHVILVVGIDEENNKYICAEARGKEDGVTFSMKPYKPDGYWGVDMEEFYSNEANVRGK